MSDESLLLDRLQIEDVFSRYAHAADEYDAAEWLKCFSDEGVFEVST